MVYVKHLLIYPSHRKNDPEYFSHPLKGFRHPCSTSCNAYGENGKYSV